MYMMFDLFVLHRKTCSAPSVLITDICLGFKNLTQNRILTHFSAHDKMTLLLSENFLFQFYFKAGNKQSRIVQLGKRAGPCRGRKGSGTLSCGFVAHSSLNPSAILRPEPHQITRVARKWPGQDWGQDLDIAFYFKPCYAVTEKSCSQFDFK